jgi:transposase InsO family protein
MLTVIDEFSRECLAIEVSRRLRSDDVLQVLADLMVHHGPPDYIRSDNGPEFTAKVVRAWLARVKVKTLFIEPGSPWENGYNESFNGKLRDELLTPSGLIVPSATGRRHPRLFGTTALICSPLLMGSEKINAIARPLAV